MEKYKNTNKYTERNIVHSPISRRAVTEVTK